MVHKERTANYQLLLKAQESFKKKLSTFKVNNLNRAISDLEDDFELDIGLSDRMFLRHYIEETYDPSKILENPFNAPSLDRYAVGKYLAIWFNIHPDRVRYCYRRKVPEELLEELKMKVKFRQ